jgi:hypothetical protein
MDTSKFPICKIHNKKMSMGKRPGDFYCPTVIGKDELGKPIWCKETGNTNLKWK